MRRVVAPPGRTLGAPRKEWQKGRFVYGSLTSGWFPRVSSSSPSFSCNSSNLSFSWKRCSCSCAPLRVPSLHAGARCKLLFRSHRAANADGRVTHVFGPGKPWALVAIRIRKTYIPPLLTSVIIRPVVMFSIATPHALNVTRLPAADSGDTAIKACSTSVIWKPIPHTWPPSLRNRTCHWPKFGI